MNQTICLKMEKTRDGWVHVAVQADVKLKMSFRAPTASGSVDLLVEEIANGQSSCSRSELVKQNIAKCAHKLSMTRNLLFGISFCSASQSAGGKNMSRENGTT